MTDTPIDLPDPDGENTPDTPETLDEERRSLSTMILRPLRGAFGGRDEQTPLETIEDLIEERGEESLPFSQHEKLLISNIFHLRDLRSADVMTPRADIVAIDISTPLDDLVALMVENGHSRIPIFRETMDEIVGMVHVKDIVRGMSQKKSKTIQDVMNPDVMFVSPAMRVLDLLREMQIKRTHMVLVVDEFGGIDGLITIEDLIEQIVGEIEDEHDTDTDPDLIFHTDGTVEADARARLDDFEQLIGANLLEEETEDEDIDTLGGLVFHLAERIPSKGEIVRHPSGLHFWIMDADPRRIKRLMISNIQAALETAENKDDKDSKGGSKTSG